MISYFEAVKRAKGFNQDQKVIDAWDFGEFWLFSLGPLNFPKGQVYVTGNVMISVDKRSGKVNNYDISSDPKAFLSAKHMA